MDLRHHPLFQATKIVLDAAPPDKSAGKCRHEMDKGTGSEKSLRNLVQGFKNVQQHLMRKII